jgi:hypothetical protein
MSNCRRGPIVMADHAHRADLWHVVVHLRANPDFMAGWCAVRPGAYQVLVDDLGLDRGQAAWLMLCKTPRPDQYDHDLAAIAGVLSTSTRHVSQPR